MYRLSVFFPSSFVPNLINQCAIMFHFCINFGASLRINIIRTSFDTSVTVAAEQLYDSLERALLLTRDDRSNPVRFDITERTMRITSASGRGNLDERLAVVTSGPDLTIAFNAKYFTELLRVCGADSVTIKLNSPADPCVAVPCGGGEDFLYLVLPVRVS